MESSKPWWNGLCCTGFRRAGMFAGGAGCSARQRISRIGSPTAATDFGDCAQRNATAKNEEIQRDSARFNAIGGVMAAKRSAAPSGLRPAGRRLFDAVLSQFGLDEH
jgi:hypothetical protein